MGDDAPPPRGDLYARVRATATPRLTGRVTAVRAGRLVARVPDARIGASYEIDAGTDGGEAGEPNIAQVTGFDGDDVWLQPFRALDGVRLGASLVPSELGTRAPRGADTVGDVVDALGRSLRTGRRHAATGSRFRNPPPSVLRRPPISRQASTGIRVIDGLLPLGVGQRVGLFAGSGVGKSTLLAQLAESVDADRCVLGLIGERGREVGEMLRRLEDAGVMERTTVVVATADAPPLQRARAAQAATAIAESFRNEGRHCLLLIDSLTRYARALRESALLSGEPPARRGYPASVFSELPRLLERAGQGEAGAITAVYTVLVEGDDMRDPIADEVRGIVDGHWVLSRRLAERGHFPAIDVLASVSRVAGQILPSERTAHVSSLRELLALRARHGDAIDLGIYEYGTDPRVDAAIDLWPDVEAFLRQPIRERSSLDRTASELAELAFAIGR